MSGCKHPIWKILSAVAALALLLPRLALGELGVCPPYSKTFGPDDPLEDIAAFIAEINLRPGGGTVNLEPGDYGEIEGVPPITGVVCIRSSSGDPDSVDIGFGLEVESGAIATLRSVGSTGYFQYVNVAASGTLIAENAEVRYLQNRGAAYLNDCSSEEADISNFGRLIVRGGQLGGESTGGHYLGSDYDHSPLENHGWALLEKVEVRSYPSRDQFDCYPGFAIENINGGTLTLTQTAIADTWGCSEISSHWANESGLANRATSTVYATGSSFSVENEGDAEIDQSIVWRCEGFPMMDTGYNVFRPDGGCAATNPTSIEADALLTHSFELGAGSPAIDLIPPDLCPSTDGLGRVRTDGDGDGIVECDTGAREYGHASVEVVVRTLPYWRSVGRVDLSSDSPLVIAVMSGGPIEPTSILFDSIVVGDFPRSAMRGVVYHDKNGDGLPDYNFWYRLDRDLVLECRDYDEPFTAMTDDGLQVTGRLQFEVVGCTP